MFTFILLFILLTLLRIRTSVMSLLRIRTLVMSLLRIRTQETSGMLILNKIQTKLKNQSST